MNDKEKSKEQLIEELNELRKNVYKDTALKNNSEELSDLYHNAPCGYHSLNPDGIFVRINDRELEWLGYTRDEIVEVKKLNDIITPASQEVFEKTFPVLKKQGWIKNVELEMIRKDGTILPVLINATAIMDERGNYVMSRSTVIDITERVKLEEERRRLEERLFQGQKMEAVGTLAGGIAHDFNNLLMAIQGYVSLMLLNEDPNHENYDKLKAIESQIQNGANLTKQILGFARVGRYELKVADMNELVHQTVQLFGRTKKEIRIHEKYMETLWNAKVDKGQIEQVLLNLFVNSWQAMPGGGELYLETQNVELDENYSKVFIVVPGKYVKISVTDAGVGMDEKTKERIFDPFFTTREMGRGTGLGLATVYGIVKGHKGIINVYSEKGHGTTFNIYLPASELDVSASVKPAERVAVYGKETVLVVDDEIVVLAVVEELLKKMGYNIHTATSGEEAVKIYRANQGAIDLIILDMVMPGLSGGDTFDVLKKVNPDVKVILSSGYSQNGMATSILERGCRAFIQKPFSLRDLSAKIRDVLDH